MSGAAALGPYKSLNDWAARVKARRDMRPAGLQGPTFLESTLQVQSGSRCVCARGEGRDWRGRLEGRERAIAPPARATSLLSSRCSSRCNRRRAHRSLTHAAHARLGLRSFVLPPCRRWACSAPTPSPTSPWRWRTSSRPPRAPTPTLTQALTQALAPPPRWPSAGASPAGTRRRTLEAWARRTRGRLGRSWCGRLFVFLTRTDYRLGGLDKREDASGVAEHAAPRRTQTANRSARSGAVQMGTQTGGGGTLSRANCVWVRVCRWTRGGGTAAWPSPRTS